MLRHDGCSATMIGKILNLSERRVRQLVNEGIITRHSPGRYDLLVSIQSYIDFLKGRRNTAFRSMKRHESLQLKDVQQSLNRLESDIALLLQRTSTSAIQEGQHSSAP